MAVLASFLWHARVALPGERAELKGRIEEGLSFRVEIKTSLSLSITPSEGKEESAAVSLGRTLVARKSVLEAEEGRPLSWETFFEKSIRFKEGAALSGRIERRGGEEGRRFRVERKRGGKGEDRAVEITSKGEVEAPPSACAVAGRDVHLFWRDLLPRGGVSPGGSWKASGSVLSILLPGLPLKGFKEGTAEFVFKGVKGGEGGRRGKGEIEVKDFKAVVGRSLEMRVSLSGYMILDPVRGIVRSMNLRGRIETLRAGGGYLAEGKVSISSRVLESEGGD